MVWPAPDGIGVSSVIPMKRLRASAAYASERPDSAPKGTVRTPRRLACMTVKSSQLRALAAGVVFGVGSAFAQTTGPAPSGTTPASHSLSEKLNQSNGVIHPKEVDPAIAKAAPKTHDQNVAPPPSGGTLLQQPK